jgi:hypothetical protein
MSEPSKLCAYCLQTELTGEEKPEHPIPASLGSSLTVKTVCDPRNEWAGREIDKPFMEDPLLTERRSMVDRRDPRRGKKARRATSQILKGETADGDRITYLVVVLFGNMIFAVPVDTTGAAVPTWAWRLDWRKPQANGATTFDDLVMARVEQMQSQAS